MMAIRKAPMVRFEEECGEERDRQPARSSCRFPIGRLFEFSRIRKATRPGRGRKEKDPAASKLGVRTVELAGRWRKTRGGKEGCERRDEYRSNRGTAVLGELYQSKGPPRPAQLADDCPGLARPRKKATEGRQMF